MILALDIGNTTILVASIRGKQIKSLGMIETQSSLKQIFKNLVTLLSRKGMKRGRVESIYICSVVPHVTQAMAAHIKKIFSIDPVIIGHGVSVPLNNHYRNPRQVGQDRLVGAYAAKILYGYPCIIIDLGTAITFDVVSKSGAYEGGMIIPGIRLSAESLYQKTALLPKVGMVKLPRYLVGKSTEESILSGIFNGYGLMCSGLIDKIRKQIGTGAKVIVTGGHTQLISRYIKEKIYKIDLLLVFRGIHLLSQSKKLSK